MNTSSPATGTAPVSQFVAVLQSFGPALAVTAAKAPMVPAPPVTEVVKTNGLPAVSAVPVTTAAFEVQVTSANCGIVLALSAAASAVATVVVEPPEPTTETTPSPIVNLYVVVLS